MSQTNYSESRADSWSPERRRRASELIHARKPWVKSTGPKTAEGKVRSSQNAWKGGHRELLRMLATALRSQRDWIVASA
jgi:hypothetical protein